MKNSIKSQQNVLLSSIFDDFTSCERMLHSDMCLNRSVQTKHVYTMHFVHIPEFYIIQSMKDEGTWKRRKLKIPQHPGKIADTHTIITNPP